MIASLARLFRDSQGSVVIETAFVVPVLAVLALGGFEASRVISRHNEMQVAAAEAAAIVLANVPDEASERDTVEDIIESSTGLADDKVTLTLRYRCGSNSTLTANLDSCSSSSLISEYIEIEMSDSYTPIWTDFGIGDTVSYYIKRRVQIS